MLNSPRSPRLYKLMMTGRLHRFSKGDNIPIHNDGFGVIMVIKGYIKRYMIANSGSIGVQIVYGPQDVFSLTRVFNVLLDQSIYDGPETYYYQSMSDVQVLTLDPDELQKAAAEDPLLFKELFGEAGCHLRSCVHTIENISLGSAYKRVAHQLVYFGRNFSAKTDKGLQLDVNLTHQDVADLLGTTRETVTMAMVKLREQGLIAKGRKIIITNLDKLTTEAYS